MKIGGVEIRIDQGRRFEDAAGFHVVQLIVDKIIRRLVARRAT
jgi:hypothetical protein